MKAPRPSADFQFEHAARLRGARLVAGVDEAGRGPLAGPVVAAAVILDPNRLPQGLADSKTLSAAQRERLFAEIMAMADVAVGSADLDEIDRLNILGASLLAMERAVAALPRAPDHVLVDGNRLPPGLRGRAETIVRGDARSLSIAAASIIAKVVRDRIMVDLAQQFPGYGWEVNAGYPTPGHLKALLDLGVSAAHRRSFKPVHNILYQDKSVSR